MQIKRLDNLLQMLEQQPEDAFLLYAIGLEYGSAGEKLLARDFFEKLLKSQPEYLPVYYQAGLLQIEMGNLEDARSILEKGMALAKSQKDMKTWHELEGVLEELD